MPAIFDNPTQLIETVTVAVIFLLSSLEIIVNSGKRTGSSGLTPR